MLTGEEHFFNLLCCDLSGRNKENVHDFCVTQLWSLSAATPPTELGTKSFMERLFGGVFKQGEKIAQIMLAVLLFRFFSVV